LAKLVRQDGVEASLTNLFRQGVYLTVEEFKGRRPVVRGNAAIEMDPSQLRNPVLRSHIIMSHSGGSRGQRTPVAVDLAFMKDHAVNKGLVLESRGGLGWVHAIWTAPGGAGMRQILQYISFGAPMVCWFSKLDASTPGLHPRYRWSVRVMRWGSLITGVPIPQPQHVPLDDPRLIVNWMAEVLCAGGTPHLRTFASSAVRLCLVALGEGIDVSGVQFLLSGDPVTLSRLAVLRRAGASSQVNYGGTETGSIGQGCLRPEYPDEIHHFHDLHALIQPGQDDPVHSFPPRALLVSSLRPTAPLILLNVSLGDEAAFAMRSCGCPLEALGWTTHLHTIRSYEKLTAGGMTFLDTDVIRVLEEDLPARFGGAPTDYQLIEKEDENGRPRLELIVHPAVGSVDKNTVAETFLNAISTGSGVERIMGSLWRDAKLLSVERRPPTPTASGKILHLHVERKKDKL
jgi:hypothetical protein